MNAYIRTSGAIGCGCWAAIALWGAVGKADPPSPPAGCIIGSENNCVAKPETYGYYKTRWRRWPEVAATLAPKPTRAKLEPKKATVEPPTEMPPQPPSKPGVEDLEPPPPPRSPDMDLPPQPPQPPDSQPGQMPAPPAEPPPATPMVRPTPPQETAPQQAAPPPAAAPDMEAPPAMPPENLKQALPEDDLRNLLPEDRLPPDRGPTKPPTRSAPSRKAIVPDAGSPPAAPADPLQAVPSGPPATRPGAKSPPAHPENPFQDDPISSETESPAQKRSARPGNPSGKPSGKPDEGSRLAPADSTRLGWSSRLDSREIEAAVPAALFTKDTANGLRAQKEIRASFAVETGPESDLPPRRANPLRRSTPARYSTVDASAAAANPLR